MGHAQEGWEVGRDGQPVLEERPRQAWSGQVRVATAVWPEVSSLHRSQGEVTVCHTGPPGRALEGRSERKVSARAFVGVSVGRQGRPG